MPVFVHLTSHRNVKSIRRTGIRATDRGVHAMPVTRNFYVSHQWLRELRRAGGGTIVAVYFRISDDELVRVGHYNGPLVEMTAAEAVALMLTAEERDPAPARARDRASKAVQRGRVLPSSPEGYEVLVGRRIGADEITRIKVPPQVVGWRYQPGANGGRPCACVCCSRGTFGIRKLLRRVEEAEAADRTPPAVLFGRNAASDARIERMRAARAARTRGE